jgi:L-lactate dehydrogenase complex protein LldF
MLHPELLAPRDADAIVRDGRRLDHAEGASKPLRSRPEPQPRGAKVHGNRSIDQAEAAARFIAAPEHEKMHDERLWDLFTCIGRATPPSTIKRSTGLCAITAPGR